MSRDPRFFEASSLHPNLLPTGLSARAHSEYTLIQGSRLMGTWDAGNTHRQLQSPKSESEDPCTRGQERIVPEQIEQTTAPRTTLSVGSWLSPRHVAVLTSSLVLILECTASEGFSSCPKTRSLGLPRRKSWFARLQQQIVLFCAKSRAFHPSFRNQLQKTKILSCQDNVFDTQIRQGLFYLTLPAFAFRLGRDTQCRVLRAKS